MAHIKMRRTMKFPTITVQHNRLGYTSKTGLYSVYLRCYFKGKTDYIRISEIPKVADRDWVGDGGRGLYVNNFTINQKITEILNETRAWAHSQVMKGNHVTIRLIKEQFDHPEVTESFNSFAKFFVRTMNKGKNEFEKRAWGTIQAYQSFLIKLDEFDEVIEFDDISPKLVAAFDRNLRNG